MQRLIFCLALLFTLSFGSFNAFAAPIFESAGDPTKPDLLYDPVTGEVFLDATDIGGTIQGYNIKNAGGGILNGNYTSILGATPTTSLPEEIGEFQLTSTATPAGGLSIGNVFPIGMDTAQLSAFVTGGQVVPFFGGGNYTWELFSIGTPPPVSISNASFSSSMDLDIFNIDFGSVVAGTSVAASSFDISNYQPFAAATEDLELVGTTGSGSTGILATNLAPFTGLAEGSTLSFDSTFDTSTAGTYSASYDLNFTDAQGTNQTMTLNLSGEVLPPGTSNASFATGSDLDVLNIDFGSVAHGAAVPAMNFDLANYQATAGVMDDLDLVSTSGSGDTGTLTTNLAPFSDLTAGNSLSFDSLLDTSSAGAYSASYDLNFTDDQGTNQTLTLNLSGEVLPPPPTPDPSNASFRTSSDVDVLDFDLGIFAVGASAVRTHYITNLLGGSSLIEDLDLVNVVGSGDTGTLSANLAPFVDLAEGDQHFFNSVARHELRRFVLV